MTIFGADYLHNNAAAIPVKVSQAAGSPLFVRFAGDVLNPAPAHREPHAAAGHPRRPLVWWSVPPIGLPDQLPTIEPHRPLSPFEPGEVARVGYWNEGLSYL